MTAEHIRIRRERDRPRDNLVAGVVRVIDYDPAKTRATGDARMNFKP